VPSLDPAAPEGGYEQFFGLAQPPFSLAPDPRFLFASASHSSALEEVARAIIRREPLVVVTGDVGTGKTLLCRAVLQRLPRRTFVSVVDDPLLDPDDLLRQLLEDFGVLSKDRAQIPAAGRHELVEALHAFLRSLAALQAHAVVIIDEAQHLQPAVLEQIRLLGNVDDQRGILLQIVLVGQNDIEPLLARPELRQIRQRVSRQFRLEPLNGEEVQQYIEHRLACARLPAGGADAPGAGQLAQALADWKGERSSAFFEPDAIDLISRISGGVPRVINLLCDRALELAWKAGTHEIGGATLLGAAGTLGLSVREAPAAEPPGSAAEERPLEDESTAQDEARATEARAAAYRFRTFIVAAALFVAAALVVWYALRAGALGGGGASETGAAAPSPASARPVTGRASAPATVAPPAASPPAAPAAVPPSAQAPESPARPSGAAAESAGEAQGRFEIVVASFRTDARASSVQSDVASLGLPTRRRVAGIWNQVICGPFPSRRLAEQAQEQLDRAGFGGSEIVPVVR
jgi:general secretion pathway protein A